MLYEIILTKSCTRHCAFCTIEQSNYIETIENIKKYYNWILNIQEKRGNQNYDISLFGGEPLLNINGIKKCIELFYKENCEITLYTNGDLLDKVYNKKFLQRINIQISVYDIFKNTQKYIDIINKLKCKSIQFAYTFSNIDINKIYDFVQICESIGINYKISISHTAASWINMSEKDVYNKIFDFYLWYGRRFYTKAFSLTLPKPIKKEFTQATDFLYNSTSNIKTCISKNKYVFSNGLMHGSCEKIFNINLKDEIPAGCDNCLYKHICTKSCLAELVCSTVPKKLCLIEKAKIEAMLYLINEKSLEFNMRRLVQYNIDKMNGILL